MVQRAVALPLQCTFLILWIAAFCRAKDYDVGGGYLVLDDVFPVSHLQQHLLATGTDATTVTSEEYLCLKLSAGLYSMVAEGLTLSWNPTHVSAGSRLRMPTILRGEGLWGEARPATRFSHSFTGQRFWALQEEAGDERSSFEVEQPLFLCRKKLTLHRRCPPRTPPLQIPPPPIEPSASAPEAIRRTPPPPRPFILAGSY